MVGLSRVACPQLYHYHYWLLLSDNLVAIGLFLLTFHYGCVNILRLQFYVHMSIFLHKTTLYSWSKSNLCCLCSSLSNWQWQSKQAMTYYSVVKHECPDTEQKYFFQAILANECSHAGTTSALFCLHSGPGVLFLLMEGWWSCSPPNRVAEEIIVIIFM